MPWEAPTEPFSSSESMICCRLKPLPINFNEPEGRIWRTVLSHIVLSRHEREVWKALKGPEKRRTNWLLGRVVGKEAVWLLLKRLANMDLWPADIVIRTDDYGKPFVTGQWSDRLDFSISLSLSHSQGLPVALAAAGGDDLSVGIDIEKLRPVSETFEKLTFSGEEIEIIQNLNESDHQEWSIRLWCAKEAASKALGTGLEGRPRAFEAIDLDPEGEFTMLHHDSGRCLAVRTSQHEGLVIALATAPGTGPGEGS